MNVPLTFLNTFHNRLIGVVGLKELRKAIEDANSGQVTRTHMHQIKSLQAVNFPSGILWLALLFLVFVMWLPVSCAFIPWLFSHFPGSRDPKAERCWVTKGLRSEKKKRRSGKCHWAGEGNLDRYLLSHPHWISGWTGVPDCCLHGLCPLPFTCLWRFRQRPAGVAVTCQGLQRNI